MNGLDLLKKTGKAGKLLIAVDGRCGCGKSRIGAELAETLHAVLFHMDDYYLPPAQRPDNWRTIPAGNMDLIRFREEVLQPFIRGETVHYHAYSCQQQQFLPSTEIPSMPAAIIDGSYSHHPLLADLYDIRLFVTAKREVQLERLRMREGEHFSAFEEIWIPMEERYFEAFSIEEKADCVIVTDQTPPAWNWKDRLS